MRHLSHSFSSFNPRKPRHRTTFLALLFLISLSTYVFFVYPTLSSSFELHQVEFPSVDPSPLAGKTFSHSQLPKLTKKHGPSLKSQRQRQPVQLDNAQELAAVTSFIDSLPFNVIPPTVDPSTPIDPQLVLDFDTRSPRATAEVQAMVDDVWLRNPVFLYAKRYSPASREVKAILENLRLHPKPTIIDVDLRDDAEIVEPLIRRLTSVSELPVLIVGGKTLGSLEDIKASAESGELQKLVAASGAVVNGAKRRKHRR